MSTTPTRFVRQRSNARYAGTCANSFVRARSRRWRDESSNCLFFVRHVIIVLIFIKYVMDRDGTNRVRVRTAPSIRLAFESRLAKKFDGYNCSIAKENVESDRFRWIERSRNRVRYCIFSEMLLFLLPSSCPFLPPSLGKTYRLFPLLVFRVNPKK